MIGLSTVFGWLAFRWIEVPIRDRARDWAGRHDSAPLPSGTPALGEAGAGVLSR